MMDRATYTLLLDFGSGWEDFTDKILRSDGYRPRECIGKSGSHEIQTVDLKLHNALGLSALLMTAEGDIPAQLSRDGAIVMKGIVRPYTRSRVVLNRMDPVSLSIMDMSATLEQYVFESLRWTGLTLINRAAPTTSLIHKLFLAAGVAASDVLVDFDRTESIPYFSLENGDTISTKLQDALYEFGLTYRATADGRFSILDIAPDTIVPSATLTTGDLRTELSLTRSDSSQKGAIVKWSPAIYKSNAVVYDPGIPSDGVAVAAGGVYPEGADASGYRLPYDISSLTSGRLLALSNARLVYSSGFQATPTTEFGPDNCRAFITSTAAGAQTLMSFQILADIWYQGAAGSPQTVQGANPKTYTAKVISDAGSALKLARILASRQTVGKQEYTFGCPTSIDVGTLLQIIDTVSSLVVSMRIVSKEFDHLTSLYSYGAEGVADIDYTIPIDQIDEAENAAARPVSGTRVIVQYSVGTSGAAGSTWVSSPPSVGVGEYVWMRFGLFIPPEVEPSSWQDPVKLSGDATRSISLSPIASQIQVTSRGVVRSLDFIVTATLKNLPVPEGGPTWTATGVTIVDVPGNPLAKTVDVSTAEADECQVSVSMAFNGITYLDTAVIKKAYDGMPAPIYLGSLAALPELAGTEPLVAGDFFLCSADFTDVNDYTKGVIYAYDGTGWASTSDSEKIMAVMDDFSKLEVDADSLVVGNLFAKRFIALEATIKTLLARLLEIQSGGAIFSGFSADGTPPDTGLGFHLSWTGLMQSMNALLIGTLRTGLNAPTNARVGIRDSSGIISRTFTGSGPNDILFQEEGAVEVQIELKITALATNYTVGSNGPAGGHVFHKDGTRYLEAAPAASEWTEKVWGPTNVNVGGTSLLLFKGSDNTALIVAALGAGDYAARLCYDLSYGGVSDWFLPSRDELVAMHTNLRLAGIGGFANEYYWCSQNVSTDSGYVKKFDTGGYAHVTYKNSTERVRAARMFSSPDLYQWRSREKSGGTWGAWSDWSASQMTNEVVTLGAYGIKVIFEADTGHTVDDLWAFEQGAMRGLAIQKSDGTEYLSASNGVVSVAQINVQDTTNKVWGAVAN